MTTPEAIARGIDRQFGRAAIPPAGRFPMLDRLATELRAYARCGCYRVSYDGTEWAHVQRCPAHQALHQAPRQHGPTAERGAFGDRGTE